MAKVMVDVFGEACAMGGGCERVAEGDVGWRVQHSTAAHTSGVFPGAGCAPVLLLL